MEFEKISFDKVRLIQLIGEFQAFEKNSVALSLLKVLKCG